MNLEPKIGGHLFEKTEGDGCGFVWGTIISFQPDKSLSYLANIAPPWGGPVQSMVQITLELDGDNSTVLKLTDSLIGHISEGLLDSLDEGWHQIYGDGGLKSFVEGK